MSTFCEELKGAREAAGYNLRELAARTKISVGALEALERGDYRRIPGGIFGRAFVRAYAAEVGLDPESTVTRFAEELAEAEREADERRRARQPEIPLDDQQFLDRQRRAYRWLWVLIAVGLVAAVSLGTWIFRLAMRAVPPTTPLPAPSAPATSGAGGSGASLPSPAPPATVASTDTTAAPVGSDIQAALVVVVECTADVVVIVAPDGHVPPARSCRASERIEVQAAEELLVDADNAGAVRLVINGRPARSLGTAGTRARARITAANVNDFF